jgi:hypothetical protein
MPHRASTHRAANGGILEPVICAPCLRRVTPRTVVVDRRIVPVHGKKIDEYPIVRQVGHHDLEVALLVQAGRQVGRGPELNTSVGQIRPEILDAVREPRPRIQPAKDKSKAVPAAKDVLQQRPLGLEEDAFGLRRIVGRQVFGFATPRFFDLSRACTGSDGCRRRVAIGTLRSRIALRECRPTDGHCEKTQPSGKHRYGMDPMGVLRGMSV